MFSRVASVFSVLAFLAGSSSAATQSPVEFEKLSFEMAQLGMEACLKHRIQSECGGVEESLADAMKFARQSNATDRVNRYSKFLQDFRNLRAKTFKSVQAPPMHETGNGCSFTGQGQFSGPRNNPNGHDQTWNVTISNQTSRVLMCHVTAVAPSVSGGDQGNGDVGIRGQYVTFFPKEAKTFTVNGAAGEGKWDVRGCNVNKTLDREPAVKLAPINVCNNAATQPSNSNGLSCQARMNAYFAWYRSKNMSEDNRVCQSEAMTEMSKRTEGGCGEFEKRFDYPDDISSVLTKEC